MTTLYNGILLFIHSETACNFTSQATNITTPTHTTPVTAVSSSPLSNTTTTIVTSTQLPYSTITATPAYPSSSHAPIPIVYPSPTVKLSISFNMTTVNSTLLRLTLINGVQHLLQTNHSIDVILELQNTTNSSILVQYALFIDATTSEPINGLLTANHTQPGEPLYDQLQQKVTRITALHASNIIHIALYTVSIISHSKSRVGLHGSFC